MGAGDLGNPQGLANWTPPLVSRAPMDGEAMDLVPRRKRVCEAVERLRRWRGWRMWTFYFAHARHLSPPHPLLLHTILHASTNIQATSVKPIEWSFLDCQAWNAIICRRVSNPNIDTCINESGRHAAQVPTMQLSKSDDTGEAPARGRVLLFARGRLVAAGLRGKQRRIICTRHGEAVRVVFPTPTGEGSPTPTLVARRCRRGKRRLSHPHPSSSHAPDDILPSKVSCYL